MGYVIDRIIYALASPLAREIIDSLEPDPGAWRKRTYFITHRTSTQLAPSLVWPDGHHAAWKCRVLAPSPTSRLALRRAVNKWRNTHG